MKPSMKIDQYLSPAEQRRLISALLVVVGFICIAAFFAFLVVPGLRYQAHTGADAPVIEVQGETGWLDPAEFSPAPKQVIPPIDPKTVMTPNPELSARGKALFDQTCATCHGPEGRGDGPGGKGLNPKPRDLTHKEGWKNGTRVEEIYKTLDEGLKGSSMVSYNYLSKKDRMALVHHVQSLGAFDHGVGDPKALAVLEKLFASAGEVIPNRIPVSRAMEKLVHEFQAAPPMIQVNSDPVLEEAIQDPVKAAQALAGLSGWQSSEQALARGVVAGLPGNGFRPAVASFGPERWKALHTSLTRR